MKKATALSVLLAAGFVAVLAQAGDPLTAPVPAGPKDRAGTARPPEPEVSFGLDLGAGRVAYRENFSIDTRESDWDGGFAALRGLFRMEHMEQWVLQGSGMFWASAEEEEEWSEIGEVFQRNDTEVRGTDILGEMGYSVYRDKRVVLTPFVGLGIRAQRFERSRFESLVADLDGVGPVSEDVTLSFLNGALELRQRLSPRMEFCGRVDLGLVVANEADNSYYDQTIDGDGGVIVGLRGGLRWAPAARHEVRLQVAYERQDLEGGTMNLLMLVEGGVVPVTLEWPDNEMDRFWVDLGWTYRF